MKHQVPQTHNRGALHHDCTLLQESLQHFSFPLRGLCLVLLGLDITTYGLVIARDDTLTVAMEERTPAHFLLSRGWQSTGSGQRPSPPPSLGSGGLFWALRAGGISVEVT